MAFSPSVPPDITESLPATIAARELAALYETNDKSADVAIGGLPFRLAISDQRPAQRESAPIRKQQFDASPEPGEQSLEQSYWLRSQTSWHRGAGIKFFEPGSEEETQHRFAESVGIDPWTRGQVTLLKRCVVSSALAPSKFNVATAMVGGLDRVVMTYADKIRLLLPNNTLGAEWTVAAGVTKPAVSGARAWVGHNTGVSSVDLVTGTVTSRYTAASPVEVYWAKSRLFGVSGASIYELAPLASSAALPTALFTHPLPDWTWTAVAEAPNAVLVAGFAPGYGAIYKFTLNEAAGGALPTLGSPIQIAEFPPSETVHALQVYLGAYVAIGTSKGLRIGLVDTNSEIQYGPLTVETTQPVRALAARDSYVYGGVQDAIEGKSGVVRVNLADEVAPMRFVYAWDAQAKVTGVVNSIAFMGATDQLAIAVDQTNVYLQSDTLYEAEGRLVTGAIRYATSEPKSFQLARLQVRFPQGAGSKVVLSTRTAGGADVSALTYSSDVNPDTDIALQLPVPLEYLSLRVDLQASANGLESPVLEGMTLKALPSPRRQRMLSYPLFCYDSEKDRYGVTVGASGSGYGWKRYAALEELEELGGVIRVQDFTNRETFSAQIETIQFARQKAPDRKNDGFGGVATVVLRKLQ